MAYIKYKELTKYFKFTSKISIKDLPQYALDYIYKNEKILAGYKTLRDKAIFTDKRMILFDVTPITSIKKIHILPYKSISTSAIQFSFNSAQILISFNSGYQLRLDFTQLNADEKKELRLLYCEIMKEQK